MEAQVSRNPRTNKRLRPQIKEKKICKIQLSEIRNPMTSFFFFWVGRGVGWYRAGRSGEETRFRPSQFTRGKILGTRLLWTGSRYPFCLFFVVIVFLFLCVCKRECIATEN